VVGLTLLNKGATVSDTITQVLPYVKDLGLPVAALWYLFKCYQERIKRGDDREDKYVQVIEAHNRNCGELSLELKSLTQALGQGRRSTDKLVERLVEKAINETAGEK